MVARTLAERGTNVLALDLTADSSDRPGFLEVVRHGYKLSDVVTLDPAVRLAMLAPRRDATEALRAFNEAGRWIPRNLDVLLVAMPIAASRAVVRASLSLDQLLIVAERDRTSRVELIAGLDATEAVGTHAQVILVDDTYAGFLGLGAAGDPPPATSVEEPATDPDLDGPADRPGTGPGRGPGGEVPEPSPMPEPDPVPRPPPIPGPAPEPPPELDPDPGPSPEPRPAPEPSPEPVAESDSAPPGVAGDDRAPESETAASPDAGAAESDDLDASSEVATAAGPAGPVDVGEVSPSPGVGYEDDVRDTQDAGTVDGAGEADLDEDDEDLLNQTARLSLLMDEVSERGPTAPVAARSLASGH